MISLGYVGHNTNIREGLKFREFSKNNTKKELGDDGQWAGSFSGCDGYLTSHQLELFRCAKDNRGEPTLAIIGDSKAAALAAGLFRTSSSGGRWIMLSSRGGGDFTFLPIFSSASLYALYSPKIPETALVILKSHPELRTVVVAAATRHLFQLNVDSSLEGLESSPHDEVVENGLTHFVDELIKLNKRIILLVDNPTLSHPEGCIARKYPSKAFNFLTKFESEGRCDISYDQYLRESKKYRDILMRIVNKRPDQVILFDQAQYLCAAYPGGICTMLKNGRPLYGYTDHISDYAAGLIGGPLNRFIQSNYENKKISLLLAPK